MSSERCDLSNRKRRERVERSVLFIASSWKVFNPKYDNKKKIFMKLFVGTWKLYKYLCMDQFLLKG